MLTCWLMKCRFVILVIGTVVYGRGDEQHVESHKNQITFTHPHLHWQGTHPSVLYTLLSMLTRSLTHSLTHHCIHLCIHKFESAVMNRKLGCDRVCLIMCASEVGAVLTLWLLAWIRAAEYAGSAAPHCLAR